MLNTFFCILQAKSKLWVPMLLFSGMCFLTGFLTLLLPETAGKPLPNTIADVRNLYIATTKNDTASEESTVMGTNQNTRGNLVNSNVVQDKTHTSDGNLADARFSMLHDLDIVT